MATAPKSSTLKVSVKEVINRSAENLKNSVLCNMDRSPKKGRVTRRSADGTTRKARTFRRIWLCTYGSQKFKNAFCKASTPLASSQRTKSKGPFDVNVRAVHAALKELQHKGF
eukprot:gene2554-2949_t